MKKLLRFVLILALFIGGYIVIYNLTHHYDNSTSKLKVLPLTGTTDSFYISQMRYDSEMTNLVVPYVDSIATTGSFTNNSHRIVYNAYKLDSARATIVISHGFTERKEKYKEMIYYFLKRGYQVFIMDHYSHGASDRYNSDSSMVYVADYHDFTSDLTWFITKVVKPQAKGRKTILYAHSMGGGIAASVVEQQPDLVDAMILSAPLMKIGTPGAPPEFLADPIARLMVLTGKGATYALGQRAYNPATDSVYNPENPATFCAERAGYWHKKQLSFTSHPTSASSWKLASELMKMSHDLLRPEHVRRIKVPILFFQAEKDTYTDPRGHYTFVNAAKNVDIYLVKDSLHEMYFENDDIIRAYFNKIFSFMQQIQ